MSGATEPRPAAALTSSLLARRGGAQPAMRRQALGGFVSMVPSLDDLGWNDMGEAPARVSPDPVKSEPSPIARQIETIAERIAGKRVTAPQPSGVDKAEPEKKARKVAFTLRLDVERHLHLRQLSAMSATSAQRFLVAALDRVIAEHNELEPLTQDAENGAGRMRTGK